MSEQVRADPDGIRSRPRGGGAAWMLWPVLAFVLLALGVSVYFAFAPVSADLGETVGEPAVALDGDPRRPVLPPISRPAAPAAAAAASDGDDAPATDSPEGADTSVEGAMPENQPTGIALFPPRGTKPVKRGIVVPDDFPLPPGYLRHYQTTDDGQQLPAILMFHPDYVPRDANGQPVPVPHDRVVPPELAPPGLPVRLLDAATAAPPRDPGSPSP